MITITITGMCQTGKTTLAHKIAALVREDGRDAKVFDARHSMDSSGMEPMFPQRLKTPVEIHVGEPFPPPSMSSTAH